MESNLLELLAMIQQLENNSGCRDILYYNTEYRLCNRRKNEFEVQLREDISVQKMVTLFGDLIELELGYKYNIYTNIDVCTKYTFPMEKTIGRETNYDYFILLHHYILVQSGEFKMGPISCWKRCHEEN